MSLVGYFELGGWMMWPILATSVVALAVVIGRLRYLLRTRGDAEALSASVLSLVAEGRTDEADKLCQASSLPVARVLHAGLAGLTDSLDELDRRLEVAAAAVVDEAEVGLPTLGTTLAVLPMLGFLGTILGLIRAFLTWQALGEAAKIDQLSGGIAAAMLTTGAGLIASIPYTLAYNFFATHAHRLARSVNAAGAELSHRARAARAPASVTPLRPAQEASS
jgi:biopolymer transport protein ExbB